MHPLAAFIARLVLLALLLGAAFGAYATLDLLLTAAGH